MPYPHEKTYHKADNRHNEECQDERIRGNERQKSRHFLDNPSHQLRSHAQDGLKRRVTAGCSGSGKNQKICHVISPFQMCFILPHIKKQILLLLTSSFPKI